MAELVSILIPAFNAEKWIQHAINSALNQTWPYKEIIIFDDGSTDNTFQVARRFESRLVKVVKLYHSGAGAARNGALAFAQGDYIQWLDADDILAPNKIALQMQKIKSYHNSRLLFSSAWATFYFRIYKAKFIPSPLWQDLESFDWIYKKIDKGSWMAIETWLVSRKLTELTGPWNEGLSLDIDGEYFCRVVAASEGVLFIPDAKCYCGIYNLKSISTSANISDHKLESLLLSTDLQNKCLLSLETSVRTRAACLNNLQRNLIYYYPEKQELLDRINNLAHELGGKLSPPDLNWKYNWIRKLFGWKSAKRAKYLLWVAKTMVYKNWDRLISIIFPNFIHKSE